METHKIILMQGLPASGKSFWAKHYLEEHKDEPWVIVSRDSIRNMLNPNKWSPEVEELVKKIKDNNIRLARNKGFNIIVDETNLTKAKLESYREYSYGVAGVMANIEFVVARVCTPFNVCLNRNKMREGRWRLTNNDMREMLASYEKNIPDGYKLFETKYIV